MSVKISRYLLASFLILSILFLSISFVAADCYVYSNVCNPTKPNTGCSADDIAYGNCGYFSNIANTDCNAYVTGINECQLGCCCITTNGNINAYVRRSGACGNTNTMIFYKGDYNSNTCTQQCTQSNLNARYDITGVILKDLLPLQGTVVTLGGSTPVTVGADGKYSFIGLTPGDHSLKASFDQCSNDTHISITSNNQEFDITLSCPDFNLSGYAIDENNARISYAVVNATYNGITKSFSTGSNGYYNFSIPYNTPITLIAQKNGCNGSKDTSISNANKEANITVACQTYNVDVIIKNSTANHATNATVTVRKALYGANSNGVYSFYNIAGGIALPVSAEQISYYPGGSIRCYNSTTISLTGTTQTSQSVNLWIGDDTCCNTTVTYGQCNKDGYRTKTTKYFGNLGSCSQATTPNPKIEQDSCNVLKPCDWVCTWSGCTPGAIQQTATCVKQQTSDCDMNLVSSPPQTVKSCNELCGNGVLDASEDCDYNVATNILDITEGAGSCLASWQAIDPTITDKNYLKQHPNLMNAICNMNDCSCKKIATRTQPDICSANPGNITVFNAAPITSTHSFNLNWAFNPGQCNNYVQHYELSICSDKAGSSECASGIYHMINANIPNTTSTYTHDGSLYPTIVENTKYCYKLTTVFGDNVNLANHRVDNITCITSGDEKCLNVNSDNSWCEGNVNRSCNPGTNKLVSNGCDVGICSMSNHNALCSVYQPDCSQCNWFFGLFNYMGHTVYTNQKFTDGTPGTYSIPCPSISDPAPTEISTGQSHDYLFGCYMDHTNTTIDKTYSCNDVSTCYDYKSEESCTQDYCTKFERNGAKGCEWNPYISSGAYNYNGDNIFGKGICAPVNVAEQDCGRCLDPKYNTLGKECDSSTCSLFGSSGQCYFIASPDLYHNSNCINIADLTCPDYLTPEDCTGGQNVSVSASWSNINNDNYQISSGTNEKIPSKDGGVGILGVCKWDPTISKSSCIRDADNISTPVRFEQDCRNIKDRSLNALCNKDTIAPTTTIYNQPKYGLMMNLSGQVSITDNNPWGVLGDPALRDPIISTFYCIIKVSPPTLIHTWVPRPTGGEPEDVVTMIYTNSVCYPNETLRTRPDNAYTINLSQYGITKADNNNPIRIFYFSEDPARNLEYPIKNFTFQVDSVPPNVSVSLSKNSYQESEDVWLTDITPVIKLENTPQEDSLPVTCSFKIRAKSTSEAASASFKANYEENNDIINMQLDYSGSNTIQTTYTKLLDGEYYSELSCVDAYNNPYTSNNTFVVNGDIRINSPAPFGKTYTTKDATHISGDTFSIPISINTTVDGTCKYWPDATYTSFDNMYTLDKTAYPANANNYYFSKTVSLNSLVDATGVYKYYIVCNLSINGQWKLLNGNDADNPYFAIDDLPPITKVQFENTTVVNWQDYNNEEFDKAIFNLACDDSDPLLPSGLEFGCNNTKYCIVESKSDGNKCTDADKASFKPIPKDGLYFDYSTLDSQNKSQYGNDPTIRFYSDDNGRNVAPITTQVLGLRNLDLANPNITLLIGGGSNPVIIDVTNSGKNIDASYVTLNVTYPYENNVHITSISLYNLVNQNSVTLEPRDGFSGTNSYRFRAVHLDANSNIQAIYIDNGAYELDIEATDNDGNVNTYTTTFTIAHSNNTVTLVSPKLGIGSTKPYTITVATNYYSDCKYSMNPLTAWANTVSKYNDPTFKPFDVTGTSEHVMTHDGTSGKLYVICRTIGSLDYSQEYAYVSTSFDVGYNDSDFAVNVTYIQNPYTNSTDNKIINGTYNATTIQIFTNQPAVCMLNYTAQNGVSALLNIDYKFFNNEDDSVYSRYYTTHNYTVSYINTPATPQTYYYTVNCTSLAQQEKIITIPINFTPNTAPPQANIVSDITRLALRSFNVSCTGLCMYPYTPKYNYAIIKIGESCDGISYNSADYNQSINLRNSSRICVRTTDILGRTAATSLDVTMPVINRGDMDINYPYAYYDGGVLDQVYAPSNMTMLNITTHVDSDCRYALSDSLINLLGSGADPIPAMYDAIPAENSFTKTLQATNSTHYTPFKLSSMENNPEWWMVICKVNDPVESLYISRELVFYWDNTTPIFTSANVVPPRIYDWSNRQNALLNVTTDDETKCVIDLENSTLTPGPTGGSPISLNWNNQNTEPLDIGDASLFASYITDRQHVYNIQSKWLGNININNTYAFNVSCWNRAMLMQRNVIAMSYDLEHNVRLNVTSKTLTNTFNGTTIPVTGVTNIQSTCRATIGGNGGQTKIMNSIDGINHDTTLTATSRNQSVNVICYTDNTDIGTAQDTYYVVSDISPPNVTLYTPNNQLYTCGLNGFNVNLNITDDTGIDSYHYSVSGYGSSGLDNLGVIDYFGTLANTNVYAAGVIHYGGNGTPDSMLQDNGIYRVDVKAMDLSGKYSDVKSISITARSPSSSILCDSQYPTFNITQEDTPFLDMVKANVSCADDTGCRPVYYYSFTKTKNDCIDAPYNSVGSYNSELTFNENGLLCVKGQDLAGNFGYGQQNITMGIDVSNPFNITPIGIKQGYSNIIVYPNVIVTNTTVTDITLTTNISAQCKYSLDPTNNTNMSDLFGHYQFMNDSANGLTHTINNFNTYGLYEQYMDIICYNALLSQPYSRKIIRIVYTASTPIINAYADPSVINDFNNRESLLTIDTNPETVCTITSNDNYNIGLGYATGQYNNALTYDTEHKKYLSYYNLNAQTNIFTYIIDCKTLGNLEDTTYVNVTYNLTNNLTIDLLSPVQGISPNRTVDLIVQTNLISNCSLKWNNVDKGGMLSNVTNRQHNSRITTTADGVYTAEVRCSTPITRYLAVANFNIIVNSSIPVAPAPRCGDGIVNGAEKCDGNTPTGLNGMTCTSGWVTTNYTGGTLKCKSDCSDYDFSSCDNGNGWCGNGRVDGPNTQGIYEQCDINVPSGLGCSDFGLKTGTLSCTSNCMINTSNCRNANGILGSGYYTCNNNILEPGEQCETGGAFGLSCTNFGYSGGSVSCSSCMFSMNACYFTVINQTPSGSGCGNNIKDGNEQCDGTFGLSTVSCKTLGNFSGGNVSCTKACKYNLTQCISNVTSCTNGKKDSTEADVDCGGNCKACGLNKTCFDDSDCASNNCVQNKCAVDTCKNNIFDNNSETDVDCGKNCGACALDKNCLANSDCLSNICTNGKCSLDVCSNGIKDVGESDVDCGGNCTSCDIGKGCNVNTDCGSDNCVNNVCVQTAPVGNPVKIPLMIIGLIFMLAGGGYIIYKTFIEKKSGGIGGMSSGSNRSPLTSTSPMMPVRPPKLTPEQEMKIREAVLKRRQGRADERKGVLQKLEDSTGDKGKNTSDDKNDKELSSKDSKSDLKSIELKKIGKGSGSGKLDEGTTEEFVDLSKIKNKKGNDNKDTFSKLKDIGKNEDKAFDKLKSFEIDNVSKKISQISGASQKDVKPALSKSSELEYPDAIKLFGNVDRDIIMSGVFKEILSQLLDSGKITKEHVSNILFEYMDKGIINKGDVAKISSELKII